MPRIEFKSENVKKSDYDYPKFKLDKKGEQARIAILESPVAEFVHNIRKPKLVAGIPEKEVKTTRTGQEYEDYKYEFVSRPICLGDYGVIEQDGSDPANCPICAEAKRSDRFSSPQRRFALHVVRYDTKANSTEVKEPFSARTEVYSFTDKVFTKLFSFTQEGFNLQSHDIVVTCENPAFAGYDFSITMKGEWTASDERKSYIKELLRPENLAPDLAVFCGSKKSEKGIEYDIIAVNEAWDMATGVQSRSTEDVAMSSVGSAGSLVGDLGSIMDSPSSSTDAWAPAQADISAAEKMTASAPVAADPASDFNDLLKGL